MRRFVASENDGGVRLSRFVLRVTRALPTGAMYKAFRNKRIKVNGRPAAADTRLRAGDVLELYLNDAFFPRWSGLPPAAEGAGLPGFETVFETDALAVLYKPAGVLSHRDANGRPGLLDAFTASLIRRGEYAPLAENVFSPALCNRLDRGTEGLILAAKTAGGLRAANAGLRQGLVERRYLCVCVGRAPTGTHSAFLLRDRGAKKVAVTAHERPGAKPIATGVELLEESGGLSLCRITLHTGRTHQIRAHLAFLGSAVAGDAKYGKPWNRQPALPHQALCAWQLCFAGAPMPSGAPLAAFAGKTFEADTARLPAWWREWAAASS